MTEITQPVDTSKSSNAFTRRPMSLYSQISSTRDAALKCHFCLEFFDLLDIYNKEKDISTFASVHITNDKLKSREKAWNLLGNTYIVKENANPQFHEQEFEINDVVTDHGCITIHIYALHPANDMPICVGSCEVAIKEMLSNDTVVKKLRSGFSEKGTVVAYVKHNKDYYEDTVFCEPIYAAIDHDSHMTARMTDDESPSYFNDFLGGCDRQRYHVDLRPVYQRSLHVVEQMFEISTSFSVPALYIRMLVEREHKNMLILQDMVKEYEADGITVNKISRANKICQYRAELAALGKESKHSFKKSEWKGNPECKWAPVNLHGQVLEVNTIDPNYNTTEPCKTDNYVLMTVGAMAAHWDKYRAGGLLSLVGDLSTVDGSKFEKRRYLYMLLNQIDHVIKTQDMESNEKQHIKDIVTQLVSISKDPVARESLTELQKCIDSEKQLEFIKLSADVERVLRSIKVTSKETISNVCKEYCLHVQRALVWSISELELENREHFLALLNRFETCFSQLLVSVVSGVTVNLCYNLDNHVFRQQLEDKLILVMFESLLSTHGDEMGMLEDMAFVISYIGTVSIQLVRSPENQVRICEITGHSFNTTVTIALPAEIYSRLPETVKCSGNTDGGIIKLQALFFSHGINEQQTIAYKMNETVLQDTICEQFLMDLESYINRCVLPNSSVFDFIVTNTLSDNLQKLNELYKVTKTKKSSDFIILAEKIGRDIGCIRFTSCKSAKDRTSMSITCEYCNILTNQHQLDPDHVPAMLEQFRRDGTRYHNTFKNIGSYKYCFNKLQRMMLPNVYMPPQGTFGDGAQQS